MTGEPAWVPDVCTLPTVEQPLRVAEFDGLFATSLLEVRRMSATHLRLTLALDAGDALRDLVARETRCCSFFRFTITVVQSRLRLDVRVPDEYVGVLDGLAARAAVALPG